ncbi:MAG TPA: hypothetical protein VHR97_11175 [Candidatus Baltobacteraceae bacterium]|jgi:hypothetical protein|nr:hypothetical protein [Candidatus Baltobacteraceae bacterium]
MITTLEQLEPRTLVRDKGTSIVRSARHWVLDRAEGDFSGLGTSETKLRECIASGAMEIVGPKVEPSVPTCLGCGCTEEYACPGGCTWVGDNACSSCVSAGPEPRCREVLEAEICSVSAIEDKSRALVELARIQCELLLDIRDALQFSAINQQTVLRALHESAESSSKARLFTASGALLR